MARNSTQTKKLGVSTRPKRGRGGGRPAASRAEPSRVTSPPEPAAVCGICSRTVVGEDGSGASSPPAICDTCSKAVVDEENYNESSQVVCGVCSKDIIDGDDDALLCEGQCASWLHRSCAPS